MFRTFCVAAVAACISSAAFAHDSQQPNSHQHHHHNAVDNTPIGIMGDHVHHKGGWMTTYRYSRMEMDGNRSDTSSVSSADILNNFMVSPLKMTMEMHMFGVMHGLTDTLTLMVMAPYTRLTMDHVNRMGVNFTTKTDGLGDVTLSGIYSLYQKGVRQLLLNAGISLPTGSIDERGDTPAGANSKLPYPMQLGSGTYDILPGVTYRDAGGSYSWGAQLRTVLRFGENSEHYRLGNVYQFSSWIVRTFSPVFSASLRLDGKAWGEIDGSDTELNPMMVPTARTDLRGGERIDVLLGMSYSLPKDSFGDSRLAVEAGAPIYQRLDGPQLETDYRFTAGFQYNF